MLLQLALFNGYGYEAILIYNTNSGPRAETHLLSHQSETSLAAKFAASERGQQYRHIFGEYILTGNEGTCIVIKVSI